jgi:hypothetical protein
MFGSRTERPNKPYKPKGIMRKKRRWSMVRNTTFIEVNRDKITAMKVDRQCPLALLVNVG